VALHNAARREVGVEDVVWDETTARYARAYVEVRAASDCGLTHMDPATCDSLGYGENIMVGAPGSDLTVAETVKKWWVDSEKKNFDSASGTCMVGRPEELRGGCWI
jgi:pathogenesis-related protein 1